MDELINYSGIYCITNKVNGKKYIGQTTKFKKRFEKYKWNDFPNEHLKSAFEKYGKENFEIIILIVCKNSDDLDMYETKLIQHYKTTNNLYGYNKDSGGKKNKKHSEETKQKMSNSVKGEKNPNFGNHKPKVPHTEEYKTHLSKKLKQFHANHPNYLKNKRKTKPPKQYKIRKQSKVIATNLDTGEQLVFDSISSAIKKFSSCYPVLIGKKKSSNNHSFKFADIDTAPKNILDFFE